jgi:hypothetical protein
VATWQFDVHLLSASEVLTLYGAIPPTIPRADFDSQVWWSGVDAPTSLRREIAKLLPPAPSWRKGLDIWGLNDGDRIDISWVGDQLSSITVRIDIRQISHVFLIGLMQIARKNEWVLRMSDGSVLQPSLAAILTAIHRSDAFRFVGDPHAFLAALNTASADNEDGSSP